ncbi:MAG: biotin transporter BioY [Planctomycetota bacterium]|nr:MAG: biotin transporter BioY [Planctomycetota bacterium]
MMYARTTEDTIVMAPLAAWIRVSGMFGFAIATALSAQIAILLPHTPVPVTLQTFVVLLAGATLGPRLATASMLLYVLLGSLGMHFFALGHWGLATLFGPTGGYLCGFVLAQPVVGRLTSGLARSGCGVGRKAAKLLAAMLLGNAVIFTCGLLWLAAAMPARSVGDVLALGLIPFLPGLAVKTAAAAAAGWAVRPLRRRFEESL